MVTRMAIHWPPSPAGRLSPPPSAPSSAPVSAPTSPVPTPSAAAPTSFTIHCKCFDGKSLPLQVEPSDTIGAIKSRIEVRTGMHVATQRIMFSGTTYKDDDLVGATPLCDGATVFVLLTRAFPATLGPFATSVAPFTARDFELPPLDADFGKQGAMWTMSQRSLSRHQVRAAAGTEFPIAGQFSPPHPITLTDTEKAAIGIVAAAKSFVWSYPVCAWSAVTMPAASAAGARPGGGAAPSALDASRAASADAARSFLSVGGFVYLDDARQIVAATTLTPSTLDAGGLQFGGYKPWRAEWTRALMKQARSHLRLSSLYLP